MSNVRLRAIFQHYSLLLSYLRYMQMPVFYLFIINKVPCPGSPPAPVSQDEFDYLIKHSACSVSLLFCFET